MSKWTTESYSLPSTTLQDILPAISTGLKHNFKDSAVSISACPDLRQALFHLAGEGLCGHERIADVGGPPNLHPLPKFDRKYSLLELTKLMEMPREEGFILGAGAGPFHAIGNNSELMPNLSYKGEEVVNLSYYAQVEKDGSASCQKSPSEDCALMCNLFGCDGKPGDVLKIVAKTRTGKEDFVSCIQMALKDAFGQDHPVSMGGVFLIRRGKAKMHVMPDFSNEPLDTAQMGTWLRFFDMSAPLVCLSVFHSSDPGFDLRMSHTHCFSQHGEGGHYHCDTTPDEVEYEAYFNVAKVVYRIDRPVFEEGAYRGQ
jgi:hypothetical protein